MRWLVALVAACGNASDPEPARTAIVVDTTSCKAAVANAMTLARRELKRGAPAMLDKLPKISELMLARCTEDRWPAEAIACMANARKPTDTEGCEQMLTPEQRERMQQAMQSL
jgi:hypothetical protein